VPAFSEFVLEKKAAKSYNSAAGNDL